MSARLVTIVVGVAVAGAAALVVTLWPQAPASEEPPEALSSERSPLAAPVRPSTPPVPGRDVPRRPPMPELPPEAAEVQARTYEEAVAQGSETPGDVAFRATIDAFMTYNQKLAEAQAEAEGITIEEIHELTYFGFLALQTQRWPDVEDLIDREITEEERTLSADLLRTTNQEFKDQLRQMVAEGAPESERWELIRSTQDRYRREYFAITGMTPELLDQLLAGDLTRDYAPAVTPIPEHIEPADLPPDVGPRPER